MKRIYSLLACILFAHLALEGKVLIWDLGDVLFKPNGFALGRQVGFGHFISRIFIDWRTPDIEPLLFDVFDLMPCERLPEPVYAYTSKGLPLPPILCHWQSGTLTHEQIIAQALPHIEQLYQSGYFISSRERALIEKAICTLLNPKILAEHMVPIERGIELLFDCHYELNPDGSRKNRLIALSNFDPASFSFLHEAQKEIFDHFDELVISGRTGLIKPRLKAYSYLIETYKVDPNECLVIDDIEVNLEAAEKLGFNTFHVRRGNYRELRQVLKEFGALS